MYINQNAKKQSETCIEYKLNRGMEGGSYGMGRVVRAVNLSGEAYPSVSPMGAFHRMAYPNDAVTVGSYLDHVYYNTSDGFYFDGKRKGDLAGGEKTFVNFSGKIFIFPDRAYYDIATDTMEHFFRSVTSKIRIDAVSNQFHAYFEDAREGNLAELFAGSKSVEVINSEKGLFDGGHKINSFDFSRGIVKFGHYEKEISNSNTIKVTLTNAVPELRGACVCKNRIFGYDGNKIYACAFGDGISWCDFDDESGAYRYENVGGDDFTACESVEEQCAFFTSDRIFKIYGDNVKEFTLKMASGYGGIKEGFFGGFGKVLGDVYFIDRNSIIKFSGTRSEVVCKINDKEMISAKCYPYGNKLYFHYKTRGSERACVLHVETGIIYELGVEGVRGFLTLYGNLCVMTKDEIIAIDGRAENLPDTFVSDADGVSYIEFDEIHNGYDRFSPSKLYLRGRVMEGGEISIFCKLGGDGEWSKVYSIDQVGERLLEFSLPASLTDSFRLKIEGRGSYTINNIYVLFS